MKVIKQPGREARGLGVLLPLAALSILLVLTGCGEKKKKDPGDTAAAAKVNREDISLARINHVLLQQRNLRPDQADATSRQILEFLIDQELAVQKASELKLERESRVQLQLDAARREVLARAYAEKVAEAAAKPTAEDVRKYYDEKPARYKERRVYTVQEVILDARPEQLAEIRSTLETATGTTAIIEFLKSRNIRFQIAQATRGADQLPPASLEALSRMSDGQARLVAGPTGTQLVALLASQSQPVTEEQARPAIEQILVAERKRKLIEDDMKQMRSAAKIEYFGKFAEDRANKPGAAASAASSGS